MTFATYDSGAFRVSCLDHAKRVTVGNVKLEDGGFVSHEWRWGNETLHTVDLILDALDLDGSRTVLDYGCGTGRIAKALIGKTGCAVIGADESPSMLDVAKRYVRSERFTTTLPEDVKPATADAAICVFVLQHCVAPRESVWLIKKALRPGAKLFVLNETGRFVPTRECGWGNDGVDVKSVLREAFGEPLKSGVLSPAIVTPKFSERTYWSVYKG